MSNLVIYGLPETSYSGSVSGADVPSKMPHLLNRARIQLEVLLGLNRVPNYAEYRVFEAIFAKYRVPMASI